MDVNLDRPMLIAQTTAEFEFLQRSLAGLTPDEMGRPDARGWSVKDHLAHIDAWHRRFLTWLADHRAGREVVTPEPGYAWEQLDQLNQDDLARRREQPLEQVLADLDESYRAMLATIESLSDAELFTPGHYPWFRGPLCQIFAHNAHLHYRGHTGRIRAQRGATDWWHGD